MARQGPFVRPEIAGKADVRRGQSKGARRLTGRGTTRLDIGAGHRVRALATTIPDYHSRATVAYGQKRQQHDKPACTNVQTGSPNGNKPLTPDQPVKCCRKNKRARLWAEFDTLPQIRVWC